MGVLAAVFGMIFVICGTIQMVSYISFNQNCKGYLTRASNANTVEMASAELKRAITYLEENEMTKGYTSVLWRTPDEDIGFWYNNLVVSAKELDSIPKTATLVDKSNMLIKLRETLTNSNKDGEYTIVPDGLQVYPNNLLFGILNIVCIVMVIIFGLLFVNSRDY